MLRAPELETRKQSNQSFDPNLQSVIAPSRMENAGRPITETPFVADADMDLLDAALIKNAVTTLHRQEEEQLRVLSCYTEARIAEIVDDHAKFLKNQKDAAVQALKTNRQKQLFEFMTEAYFRQSLVRARALQRRKTREFHMDAVEQQNREFLARALSPENALNDEAQTAYRNMILFNLENLYQDAPKEEREKALDKAAGTLYRKIIEKRMEIAPETATVLLEAAAVQRILGKEMVRDYRGQVAALVREAALQREASALVDEGATPAETKTRADGKTTEDRKTLLRHYDELRYQENRKKYLTHILNIDTVWRELLENDGNIHKIPAWVRNTNPLLHATVLDNWALREKNGGLPPPPDFALLVEFVEEFDAKKVAERFRDESELYGFITRLGGPDGEAFQMALRVMLGKATRADYAYVRDLRLTLDRLRPDDADGDAEDDGELDIQDCLLRFDRIRRIMLERTGHEELDEFEVEAVLGKMR